MLRCLEGRLHSMRTQHRKNAIWVESFCDLAHVEHELFQDAAVARAELPTSSVSEKAAGAAGMKKIDSRFKGGIDHPMSTDAHTDSSRRMDDIFTDMKKVLPGLDLLTTKILKEGRINDVKLKQERSPGMPAKSGRSFIEMMTAAVTKALLDRVKREFSTKEYDYVTRKMDAMRLEFRAYEAERKRIYRKKG